MKKSIDISSFLQEKAIKIDISAILKDFDKDCIHKWIFPNQKIIALSIENEKLLIYNYELKKKWANSAKDVESGVYEQFTLSNRFYVMDTLQGANIYSFPSMKFLYSTTFLDLTLPTAGITTSGDLLICHTDIYTKDPKLWFEDEKSDRDLSSAIVRLDPIKKKIIQYYQLPISEYGLYPSDKGYFYCTPYEFNNFILSYIEYPDDDSQGGIACWKKDTAEFVGYFNSVCVDYYSINFQAPHFLILDNKIIDLTTKEVIYNHTPKKGGLIIGYLDSNIILEEVSENNTFYTIILGNHNSESIIFDINISFKNFDFDCNYSYYQNKNILYLIEKNELFKYLLSMC